jgi:hypothetical protein
VGLLVLLACGCDEAPPQPNQEPPAQAASDYDPADTGVVAGRVMWEGAIPQVPDFSSPTYPRDYSDHKQRNWPNPNAPRVDAASRGVAGAIVFLRGVDPGRCRPWDHAPVSVVLKDFQLAVQQGDTASHTGFVRRGTQIDMVSRDQSFHLLQARGAAFFTLAFPDPDAPRTRRLDRAGVVEVTSGAGCFWMRGYLFVDDHPYYTRTDAQGRFRLDHVPAGTYQTVCWLPDWRAASHERDGDTCLIARLSFRPPVELKQSVTVTRGGTANAAFTPSLTSFDTPR